MATLHIEHKITDFATWKTTFDRFSDKRTEAGCSGHRIHQPEGDPHWIVVELDFPTVKAAQGFETFLKTKVWTGSATAPALVGTPTTRILVDAPAA